MKRISKLLVLFCIFLIPTGVSASIDVLYQSQVSHTIAGGITQSDYYFLTKDGWINANVIVADMSNTNLSFTPIWSDSGVQNLATTKNLVTQKNALAGVNADFFAWASDVGTGKGSPIGGVVSNGQLASSGSGTSAMAAFMQYKDGYLGAGFLETTVSVRHVPTGAVEKIGGMNKFSDLVEPVVYTNEWGAEFKSVYSGMCKVVCDKNGIVTDVTGAIGSITIPDGGFILALIPDKFPFINLVQIGDKLQIETTVSPDLSQLKSAVGAGTYLVNAGVETSISHGPSGRNPRTGIGTDSSGKILYLITVDGRQNSSIGATLPEFAGIMRRIGVHTGVNFDGGGSTQMTVKELDGTYKVANSPSENRAVANVAAITSNGKFGTLSKIVVEPAKTKLYLGESTTVKVIGLDQYGNEIQLDNSKLTITGAKPTTIGKNEIRVTYGSLSSSVDIMVFESNTGADSQNKETSDADFTFNIFGDLSSPKTLADNLIRNRLIEFVNSGGYNIVAGYTNPSELKNAAMLADHHYALSKENNLFIALDNHSGGLRATNSVQWSWLSSMCDTLSENNVFIILSKDIAGGGFTDSRELDAFYDMLQEKLVARGKTVYIFSNSAVPNNSRREGIRYITAMQSAQNSNKNNVLQVIDSLQYVQVSVKGNEVTWTTRSVK